MKPKYVKSKMRKAAFAREFLRNGNNATQAYLAVYNCSYDTARNMGACLLKQAYVVWLITEFMETGPETGKARG